MLGKMLDYSILHAFSKYNLKGEKAHSELQRICTANIKNIIGKTTYTQMLNEDGGIETDLTVVCIEKNFFRIITSAANREHDKFHILKHLSKEVELPKMLQKKLPVLVYLDLKAEI